MNTSSTAVSTQLSERILGYIQVVLGAIYIVLLSQFEISLYPVPITLHTFAIFSLALYQGAVKSCYSLLLFLIAATLGLPVFPNMCSDPLWMIHPTAGYCLSFPLAAYIVGKSTEFPKPNTFIYMLIGLCLATVVIYVMGASWLAVNLGWEKAFIVGVYPFVIFDIVKFSAALSIKMAGKYIFG